MRATWQLAINSLAGRPGRTALLIGAIVMAAALTVATAGVFGSMQASLRTLIGSLTGLGDVRIRHQFGERFDASLKQTVANWPGVEVVAGQLEAGVTLRADNGARSQAIAVGVEPEVDAEVHVLNFLRGGRPSGTGQVAVDQTIAETLDLEVGDVVTAQAGGATFSLAGFADKMLGRSNPFERDAGSETIELTVTGVFERPKLLVLQRRKCIVTLPQAEALAGVSNAFDHLIVKLEADAEVEQLKRRSGELPEGLTLQTLAGMSAGVNRMLRGWRLMYVGLTLQVFLSAGFIIVTGLTTSVIQRLRELAVLRCIGASWGQIAAGQLLAGVILAATGAAIGTAVGLAMTWGFVQWHRDILIAGFSPDWVGVAIAVGAALLAGLGGAAYPAWRAATVSPVQGLASRAGRPSAKGLAACGIIGGAFALIGPAVLLLPVGDELLLKLFMGVSLPAMIVGWFMLTPPLFVGLMRLLSPVVAKLLCMPAAVLRQTAEATPYRLGFTGAAFMVGLAMLISIWTVVGSVIGNWFVDTKMPDGYLFSPVGLSVWQWEQAQQSGAIELASPTTMFPMRIEDVQFGIEGMTPPSAMFTAFEPESFFAMTDLEWVRGDADSAMVKLREGRGLLVSREYLIAHGIGIGTPLVINTPLRGPVEFEVVGVVASPGLDVAVSFFGIHQDYADASVSTVFGTREDAAKYFGVRTINLVLVKFPPDRPEDQVLHQLQRDVPGVVVGSATMVKDNVRTMTGRFLTVTSMVAGAVLLIACFGVANIIIANVTMRRFEYGVLRAIGASRSLLVRLVLVEATVLALCGGGVGVLLGLCLAAGARTFHERMLGLQYDLAVPAEAILGGLAVTVLAALLAAAPAAISLIRAHPRQLLATDRGA